jgi:hypothetical protein
MNQEKIIAEIVKRYNAGEKESARKYFIMSSWMLSENTRKYFNFKLGLTAKIPKLAKEACDMMGGKLYDERDNLIYENTK